MTNPWIVEYSTSQRCCHVDLLQDSITKNRAAIENRERPDFVVVAVFDAIEDAEHFAETFPLQMLSAPNFEEFEKNRRAQIARLLDPV